MSDYIPPQPSSLEKVIGRIAHGEWKPSRYGSGLVLTDRSDSEDGVLGVEDFEDFAGAADWQDARVYEYTDGNACDTGVTVMLGPPDPPEWRLRGHEDIKAVTKGFRS